jgi:hypothetical protein
MVVFSCRSNLTGAGLFNLFTRFTIHDFVTIEALNITTQHIFLLPFFIFKFSFPTCSYFTLFLAFSFFLLHLNFFPSFPEVEVTFFFYSSALSLFSSTRQLCHFFLHLFSSVIFSSTLQLCHFFLPLFSFVTFSSTPQLCHFSLLLFFSVTYCFYSSFFLPPVSSVPFSSILQLCRFFLLLFYSSDQ